MMTWVHAHRFRVPLVDLWRATESTKSPEQSVAKTKTAYQDFLMLWKDADPDIPIYEQATAEYAKLQ